MMEATFRLVSEKEYQQLIELTKPKQPKEVELTVALSRLKKRHINKGKLLIKGLQTAGLTWNSSAIVTNPNFSTTVDLSVLLAYLLAGGKQPSFIPYVLKFLVGSRIDWSLVNNPVKKRLNKLHSKLNGKT